MSGVLKTIDGGDMGPLEWGEDRCFSVFYGTSLKSFKEDMGHWCLDHGIGLGDKSQFLNVDRANNDMAMSKDLILEHALENRPILKK